MAIVLRSTRAMRLHPGIAALALFASGQSVSAEADAPFTATGAAAEQAQGKDDALTAAAPAEAGNRIWLEQPIGQVAVGPMALTEGRRKYAARSIVAGSGTLIRFSSTPVANGIRDASLGLMTMPVGRARLTSDFGVLRLAADGGTRRHAGVDLAAPMGSPVTAAYGGRVASAGWRGGYGLLVVLDHGNGVQTRYAHLSRVSVSAGNDVRQGEVVGFVGSTGNSTGPHLHYELRQHGNAVNPLRR